MASLKIFIGSSSEAKECAQLIQELLQDLDSSIEVWGWWNDKVFESGDTHIESLFKAISITNSAILIFAEDDRTERRGVSSWTTRDNILLEYGMFAAAHGRRNVMIAKLGNPSLPSDLSGVNVEAIEKCEDGATFKEKNRGKVRKWLEAVKSNQADKPAPETVLPRLYQAMLSVLGAARSSVPDLSIQMDYMAAELVNAIALSFETGNLGVDDDLAESVKFHLHDCISISAYEVTGPASWVSPTIFRYLSSQIRQYLWANIMGGKWHLQVHAWLGEAINNSIKNAQQKLRSQSLTIFDNPQDFHWEVGTPSLQYSRVLFWTKEELAHSITQSVIDIHEAFNVPLFFVEANLQNRDKDLAFIVFEKSNGSTTGRYGLKRFNYKTREIQRGSITGFGDAMQLYQSLLKREDIMFAKDARELLYLNSI